jgi:uncharacterized metal-binding protein
MALDFDLYWKKISMAFCVLKSSEGKKHSPLISKYSPKNETDTFKLQSSL